MSTTNIFYREGPCPECGQPATLEFTRTPIEESPTAPPKPTHVACTNPERSRYIAPPRLS